MDLTELARSLISLNTENPPGNEEECARFVLDHVSDLHLEMTEARLDRFAPRRANLVVRIGPRRPGLLLGGHTDVVPAGDPSRWSHDPFAGDVKDGRLYGRGSADMKTGLAAILKAIESLKGERLKRGLTFVATAGEEAGFEGLSSLIGRKLVRPRQDDFGVLAEPTDLKPVRAHKGGATFRVTFMGKSGHASRPDLGVNAVESCALFVSELSKWCKRMRRVSDPELGPTLASPTVVRGGTKSNVIPEACELIVDTRWIPSHGTEFVRDQLSSIIDSKRRLDKRFRAEMALLYQNYSLNIPRTHQLVKLAESVSGARSEVAPYGTEAALYSHEGIPTIVLGPGKVEQAHIVDEYIELEQARRAQSVYAKMIEQVCL